MGPELAKDIGGREISPFIAGDAAFPLRFNVMKNFKEEVYRESLEGIYNYHHIHARRVVENAFGRMKMRFHICRFNNISRPEFLTKIVSVCCALHNVCTRLNDDTEIDWIPRTDTSENVHQGAIEEGIINARGDRVGSQNPSSQAAKEHAAGIRLHIARWLRDTRNDVII